MDRVIFCLLMELLDVLVVAEGELRSAEVETG